MNDVVKCSDLQLDISVVDTDTNKRISTQQCKTKVMKPQYFDKTRTSTPKSPTQPLNLTYGRFWIEIVKDQVYLRIFDWDACKRIDKPKRPIRSVIGACVDKKMEIGLAIMSSFEDTHIMFEWVIRKKYIDTHFRQGITVCLRLSGNQEQEDWKWSMSAIDINNNKKYFNFMGMYPTEEILCDNKKNQFTSNPIFIPKSSVEDTVEVKQ